VRVLAANAVALPPHALTLTFDQDVAASLVAGDLLLQNLTTGAIVPVASMALAYNTTTNTATITFPGQPGGRLADGLHQLTTAAAAVADPAGNTLAAPFSHRFTIANDSDGDGMGDAWEIEHLLAPGSAADATADADGDGAANLDEYRAGTHPRDPGSRFIIDQAVPAGAGIQLTWRSVAGRRYQVEWSDDMATWSTLASGGAPQVIAATGPFTSHTVSRDGNVPRRVYRIKVLPP